MLTAEQQARLDYLDSVLGPSAPPPPPQGGNLFARAGSQVANLPSNISEGLQNSGIGLLNMLQPSSDPIASARWWKPFDILPAQTFGEKAVDVGAGIAQVVGEAAIPGGLATKGARLLGAGTAAPIIGDTLAGMLQGIKQSPGEAAGTGAEFGALGAANRFIPSIPGKLLANAAIPITGQLLRGQSPLDQQSLINTGANIAVPALLGQYGRRLENQGRPLMQSQPPAPDTSNAIVPYVPPQRGFSMPGYERPGMMDPTSEPPQWVSPQPVPPTAHGAPLALPGRRRLLQSPQTIQTGYTPPEQAAWEGYDPSAERGFTLPGYQSPQGFQPSPRQPLRLADQQSGIASSAATLAPEAIYDQARRDYARDYRVFTEATRRYRAREIGDEEFLRARAEFDKIQDRWDISEQAFIDAKNNEPPPVPPENKQQQLFGFDRTIEPSLMRSRSPERGAVDPANPAFQYLAGASGGALAGPLIDQDQDKPVWEKILEGAGIGLGAVAGARGGAKALLRRTPTPEPATVDDVARMGQQYGGVTVKMLNHEGELPGDVLSKIQASLDLGARHEGIFDPANSTAYLFRQNLADPARAQQVLAHEVAGHFGFDQVVSKSDWRGIQDSAVKPGNAIAEDVAQTYYRKDVASLTPAQGRLVAREYVARLAENTELNPNLWEKIKTSVNGSLRNFGVDREWSDSEIKGLIQKGHQEISRGPDVGTAPAGERVMASASPADYEALSNKRLQETGKTAPVEPTPEEIGYIRAAYEKAVKKSGYPSVPIADVMEEAFSPGEMDAARGMAIHLHNTGEIVSLTTGDWSISPPRERAWGVNPLDRGKGYSERPALMMRMAPTSSRPVEASLFRSADRAAADQERGDKTLLGASGRIGEREFNIGKPANVTLAQERGRGEANKLRMQQDEPSRLLRSTTPADQAAVGAFFKSKRTAQDVSLLRSSATPEAAKAAEALHAVKRTGQQIQFEATDNPTRQDILQNTPDYQATSYQAFEDTPNWQKTLKDNPALRDNFVKHILKNVLPGFETFEAEQAVDSYKAGILRGQDFSGGGAGNAAKISQYLFTHRKNLSPEVKDFLGEYKDPIQKEVFTVHKLINSAAQAKTISSLAEMGARGELPIMDDATRRVQWQAAKLAGDTAKMEDLAALEKMPDAPSFGKLANKLVPRSVIDALDAHGDAWKGGWSRGMSGATSWLKQAMTVDNPATHARQWIQTPMVAMVARVAPWDFIPAAREIRSNSAMHTELLEQHMIGADVSSQDIQRGALEMDNGFNPTRLGKTMSTLRGVQKWMQKMYGLPDQLVRVAAYIKHKPRFFAEGNAKGLHGAELERYARNETTKWVNDHTMNYGTVPNFVKLARNTPFVSPFISYQSEMLKLLHTLCREAIHGSPSDRAWALSNLGMLVAAPLLIAQAARGQLSDKDRAEWDRVQRLSPAYSGSQIRVPLGRNGDGSFRYLNIANLAPAGDTAALARNIVNGDAEKLFAGNQFIGWDKTPVLSIAAEQIAGRDLMTDRKFQGPVDRATALLKSAVPPWMPPAYEGQRIMQSLTPNAEGGLGTMNARTGQEATPGLELLRLSGIPVSRVQPAALLRRATADERDRESQIKGDLRNVPTNATGDAWDAAREKARRRLLESREELRNLIR